ncbi:large subunit ribosomal protein L15 [Corynebacterium mucifaciens]|uniref:Large ribosomal subunit protein uL15 n=1 Tax=Corynebacterium mucifaciens TaxID=57171 RepID=A0A7X6LQL8_9CORY|nr:50S ribosomal protein L15 [Corynebacterium mucifaciens]
MADIIKLHDLRPAEGANKAKTRVGRGEASKGKTAGRGTKGTKARKQVSAAFEGGQMPLHMRLPKLKGFKNPNRVEYQVVNLADLAEAFPQGGDIAVADIVAKGLVRPKQPVKVLAEGDVTVALNVTANKFSKSAEEKLNAAGGSATTVAFSKRAANGEGPVASAAGEAAPAPEAGSGAKGVLDSDPLQGGSTTVDADPEA